MSPRDKAEDEFGRRVSRKVVRGFRPDLFRRAREAAGISRADLARYADLSVGAIRAWERDDATPQVDTLARAVSSLQIKMEDVVVVPVDERRLADLRVLQGLTQPQLAASAGLATSTLAGLEQGHVRLHDHHAVQLAAALHLSPSLVRTAYERTRKR